jgi:23S rRNA pseudouridine1911/1915/1917 synthase
VEEAVRRARASARALRRGMESREESFTVESADDRMRLDLFLAARLPDLSRAFIQKLAREGGARVAGSPSPPSRRVRAGQTVSLRVPSPAPSPLVGEPIPLHVLYEDEDLLVLSKPAGMVVHPGAGVASGTLVHALLARGPHWSNIGGEERPGIVHRLDRGTSGVMVVARNDRAHRALAAQFKAREVEKSYLALVWGAVAEDQFDVDAPLGRDVRRRRRISTRTAKPRSASTTFQVLERLGVFTLLEARPRTGRTHQIRAHLDSVGHPIVGDAEYGGDRAHTLGAGACRDAVAAFHRLALHARRLAFSHPADGRRLAFEAPIPAELENLLAVLRAAPHLPRTPGPRSPRGSRQ